MTISRQRVYSAGDGEWSTLLKGVRHDVYHTPEYHLIPGFGRDGEACVFTHQEGDQTFLWPYVLSPIGKCHFDVTSVYGYAGPVSSPDPAFIRRGWMSLLDHWRNQNVVSVFTRFHPLIGNSELMVGLQDAEAHPASEGIRSWGSTVSIDLSIPLEQQVRGYQKVLRQEIRKSRELGFVTFEDTEWQHIDDFVQLYRGTMDRRNGRNEYMVDSAWVIKFRALLGGHARLFVTKWQGVVAAALLAMEYSPFLHAHLTGINADLVVYSPLKVLLDFVRVWGSERGLKSFHLGGGLGGREDSLFQFKRRFSPLAHEFRTGSWILNPAQYQDLAVSHKSKMAEQGIDFKDPGFFPIYRYQPDLRNNRVNGD